VAFAIALCATAATGRAQTLHDGWLCELLELNPSRAAHHYNEMADNADALPEYRALARARLLELAADDSEDPALRERSRDLRQRLLRDPIVVEVVRDPAAGAILRSGRSTGRRDGGRSRTPQPAAEAPPRALFAALIPVVEARLESSGRDRQIRELMDRIAATYRRRDGETERAALRAQLHQLAPQAVPVNRRHYAIQLLEYQLAGRDDLADRFRQLYVNERRSMGPWRGNRRSPEEALRRAQGSLPDLIEQAPDDKTRDILQRLQRRLESSTDNAGDTTELIESLDLYAPPLFRRNRGR